MAESPHSIVLFTPGFPANVEDRTCVPPVQNYVKTLVREHPNIHVHVVAFQYPFERSVYTWNGATVYALAGNNRRGARRIWTWILAAFRLALIQRRSEIAVLHTFWLTECTWVGQWLSRLFHIPHVATLLGQDAREKNPYLPLLQIQRMTVVSASRFAGDVFRESTGREVDSVIPIGIDWHHVSSITSPGTRSIDLLGVGSLIPLKRFGLFMDIVECLLPSFPALQTCIVGGGPEGERLARLIDDRGLDDHIHLMGERPRDEVLRVMGRSKILLHPSLYEGQGYVFLEALAQGMYVVCSDVGFPGHSDRAFPCTSKEQMIDTISRLLQEEMAFEPTKEITVTDTVRAYERFYALDGKSPKG